MKVRQRSVAFARELIRNGDVEMDSDWSDAQPSSDDENEYLEDNDWQEYADWFLAEDEGEDKGEKGRYAFPYGDFDVLHRSGVIAAKQRAAQYGYGDVEEAADELLALIDELEGEE